MILDRNTNLMAWCFAAVYGRLKCLDIVVDLSAKHGLPTFSAVDKVAL